VELVRRHPGRNLPMKAGPGRPRGSRNKLSGSLRAEIWDTSESAGRVISGTYDLAFYDHAKRKFIVLVGGRKGYLLDLALNRGDQFVDLMRAMLPMQRVGKKQMRHIEILNELKE